MWRGRFAGLANAVNCYSPSEDVLANVMEGLGGAWSAQELLKGSGTLSLMPRVVREAGWGFNPSHTVPLSQDDLLKTEYTEEEMKVSPPFLPFADEWLHTTNAVSEALAEEVVPRILADGIPATTVAAGANRIDGVAENVSFHDLMANEETWPEERMRGEMRCWEHSDIKNLSYPYVYKFFERLVRGY